MTYLQAAHCPDGESPAHEVAEIPIYPAAIRSYARDLFRNEKRIQALYIGARENRIKPTAKARSEDVLPLIGTRSGMREIYVVVAWHSQGYKRSDRERTRAQVVPHVYSHVLKVDVIVPTVNWQLMGSRSVVLGKHKWDTDIHRQLVRDSEINVLDENEGADVADLQPFTTRAKMVLDKVVLQGKRCRPFTLCRNPGLAGGEKRQEQDKACKGNERSQDLCSAHGVLRHLSVAGPALPFITFEFQLNCLVECRQASAILARRFANAPEARCFRSFQFGSVVYHRHHDGVHSCGFYLLFYPCRILKVNEDHVVLTRSHRIGQSTRVLHYVQFVPCL